MRSFIALPAFRQMLLLLGLLAGTSAPAATVLVVGDSISAGYGVPTAKVWVNLLATRVTEAGYEHTVVNASLSGDTTAGGVSRLPALLRRHEPAIVVIGLGGNDGLRGLPLKATRQNLQKMVSLAQKSGAVVMLLGMDLPPNLGPAYAREFRAMYPSVAKAGGAVLVPGFIASVGTDRNLMQSDGIHPNSLAQPKLADTVWTALEPQLKKLR